MSHQSMTAPAPAPRPANSASGLASMVKGIVTALLRPRETFLHHRAPTAHGVHQLRRDIKAGKARPIEQLLRVTLADIDDGIPLPMATQYLQEALTVVEQYSARRERRLSAGVLPFGERLERAAVRETAAQSKGDIAITVAAAHSENPDVIRAAVLSLQAEAAPKEELEQVLTERLVELTSR